MRICYGRWLNAFHSGRGLKRSKIRQNFKIEYRWSGIMGVGRQKKAIVKPLSNHAFCGIRLGGMGVAIGATIGKELADLIN